MSEKFPKDAWIQDALVAGYIKVGVDGGMIRCVKADKQGNLLSDRYLPVKYQVHKKSGRVYFNLTWKGVTKSVLVNRVVALRFLPNPQNLPQVNHIDGNKENNALSNLEWASGEDNEKHAHRTGLKSGRGSANSNAKLTGDDAFAIRVSPDPTDVLAARYGVSKATISSIKAGRTWTHV